MERDASASFLQEAPEKREYSPPVQKSGESRLNTGLTALPRQNSSGGKDRLGRISKMGNQYLRRLLVVGATALIRFARNRATPLAAWADKLLARRPARLVSVALANKIARVVWVVLVRGDITAQRRAAVEPVIGHLREDHRMGRNYLAHSSGDAINAVLAAVGYNFRLSMTHLRFHQNTKLGVFGTGCRPEKDVLHGRLPRAILD